MEDEPNKIDILIDALVGNEVVGVRRNPAYSHGDDFILHMKDGRELAIGSCSCCDGLGLEVVEKKS